MTKLIVVAAIVVASVAAHGVENAPAAGVAPPGRESLRIDQYYGDAVSHIGEFPGKLVCVSTKQPFVPQNATPCGPDKVYALELQGSDLIVPVLASSEAARTQFSKLLDQTVVVRGKHYPDKGFIAAASVDPRYTTGDAPSGR